ncbi:1-acyl-sn-glycerol-3-phosphate acyltransferase [Polaribacter reichenbachii]|uniref:Acyl-phosphate glycerol 3-phosphate acyltransferase n=1 Tax=Polaribacter reichenbachii TaxID=996801 RepID=A0A1B8TVU0_9FLAO|nr:lysophospholipid acyltransferase family protein [Polaribacter reichenbachii]APZ45373.1 1-acyl-sn-glycerol-3-phosphate acyltransferase [Polaribacter reichenbachii]AUC19234.1 1-acyl-sn-glycerol-3-phosphate acyltransferase [Polaribacter reichenbachii]OBY63609.1 acyl-phosphate glycerol 3-phosphate acyltransferase [Polaribacter reichenbachii]
MKYLKIPFLLIWRAWFYILMVITILLMLPFLLVLTAKEFYYPTFWKMIRIWSKVLIFGMGFRLKIQNDQVIESDKSYMFCPNHTSLMDPFVLVVLSKNPIVFVGKKEFVKIPIFGFFYKKVVIMVDRSDVKSRKKVFELAKKKLQNGVSMAIFPEGLVPTENIVLAPFKKGAFSLAIEFEIPIVPQVYFDCKRLFSWDFFKGGPGVFRIHQHKFIETKGLEKKDIESLKVQTFNLMYNDLINDKKFMKDTNRPNNEREFKSPI